MIQEARNSYGLGTGQKQEEETLRLAGEREREVGERAVCVALLSGHRPVPLCSVFNTK